MTEKDELDRLYHESERALLGSFLTEHQVARALAEASAEEIKEWFGNLVRTFSDDGEAAVLALLVQWFLMESSRDTLVKLAVWLEIQASAEDDEAPEGDLRSQSESI